MSRKPLTIGELVSLLSTYPQDDFVLVVMPVAYRVSSLLPIIDVETSEGERSTGLFSGPELILLEPTEDELIP